MLDNNNYINISDIMQVCYCERRLALIENELSFLHNQYTIDGTIKHQNVHSNKIEKSGDIVKIYGLYIKSEKYGICGISDLVELKRDDVNGTKTPFSNYRTSITPIEFKRGKKKQAIEYETQLCAQVLCLEEMYNTRIEVGYLFFIGSQKRKEIVIDDKLRETTIKSFVRAKAIIDEKSIPKFDGNINKCNGCSMFETCQPKWSDLSVKEYKAKLEKIDRG